MAAVSFPLRFDTRCGGRFGLRGRLPSLHFLPALPPCALTDSGVRRRRRITSMGSGRIRHWVQMALRPLPIERGIMMHWCYRASMRTTIDLPSDLHDLARQLAHDRRRSMSEVIADLIRLGLGHDDTTVSRSMRGMPQISVGRSITAEDVRSLDDER
jgi:predicted transcriptional regulator